MERGVPRKCQPRGYLPKLVFFPHSSGPEVGLAPASLSKSAPPFGPSRFLSPAPLAPTHQEVQQQPAEGSAQGAPGSGGGHVGAGRDAERLEPGRSGGTGAELLATASP